MFSKKKDIIHLSRNSNLRCVFLNHAKGGKKVGSLLKKTSFFDFFYFLSCVIFSDFFRRLFKTKRFNIHANFFNIRTYAGTKVIALKLDLSLILSHKKELFTYFSALTPTEESNARIINNLNYGIVCYYFSFCKFLIPIIPQIMAKTLKNLRIGQK